MRVTIHSFGKAHGVTLEDVGDTPVEIFMHSNGTVSIDINGGEDDGDDDDDLEPDPRWSDAMLGRN